ncbi:MAG TPA: ribosome recycling factor [Patescibacteria group bacterium]|nr:ribosome recycling factor [Patescibacteria group bacterium]
MPVQEIINKGKDLMGKAVEHCQKELGKVRTGRASAQLVEGIKVDYYGNPTPVSQVGNISVPDARTIIIQPWERNILGAIEKAIFASGLGMTPSNDGQVIRIPVPPLTEERRKEFVKLCKKFAEEGKVAVRNIRRDQMEAFKKGEKDKIFSEDDRKRGEEELQKVTDRFIKDIDAILVKKEKEIMEE